MRKLYSQILKRVHDHLKRIVLLCTVPIFCSRDFVAHSMEVEIVNPLKTCKDVCEIILRWMPHNLTDENQHCCSYWLCQHSLLEPMLIQIFVAIWRHYAVIDNRQSISYKQSAYHRGDRTTERKTAWLMPHTNILTRQVWLKWSLSLT